MTRQRGGAKQSNDHSHHWQKAPKEQRGQGNPGKRRYNKRSKPKNSPRVTKLDIAPVNVTPFKAVQQETSQAEEVPSPPVVQEKPIPKVPNSGNNSKLSPPKTPVPKINAAPKASEPPKTPYRGLYLLERL